MLLRRVVESFKGGDFSKLIEDVQRLGQRLVAAQPKELAVGNIVRRVLSLIREELEEDRDGDNSGYNSETSLEAQTHPQSSHDHGSSFGHLENSHGISVSPSRNGSHDAMSITNKDSLIGQPSGTASKSMFNFLSQPHHELATSAASSGTQSPVQRVPLSKKALANSDAVKELKAEIVEGILEIMEELNQADDQIAGYALEHIHSNEIVLIHSASETVGKFLLKAAAKRKFTVLCVEGFPNAHEATYSMLSGEKKDAAESNPDRLHKTLTAAGLTVVLIPDSAVFAVMSRVNKVILDTHVVIGNGGLIATAGAKQIAQTARVHRTPVVVLSGVYKLSPVYPFDIDMFLETGDPSKVVGFQDRDFTNNVEIENPLFDYVPADLIDIYVTNL